MSFAWRGGLRKTLTLEEKHLRVYSGEDLSPIVSARNEDREGEGGEREGEKRKKKQVEEICGIPSEIASLMDSFSCQLRREMKLGKINS